MKLKDLDNELKTDLNNLYKQAKDQLKEGLSKAIAELMIKF